ncbi:LpqB family beta-propeller domain-containing protein [Nigerium massiliense]|uniref:LpqB family beta-propeller domain-containing protein n=1 Tax=Nigerium massiliense TaxID=1522317 RepID=UPI00058F8263|nr:LpqB family beta-propeller domain-containing protein [Nigerium massiliense]
MRRRVAAVLACLTALSAGCTAVPTSGPVVPVPAEPNPVNPGVRVNPHPPTRGESAEDVVDGFVAAMASYETGYEVAREYLTPEAAARWDPRAGVQVYEQKAAPTLTGGRYVLSTQRLGAVNSEGIFRQATGTITHDFGVVRDASGEWRIANPPTGLLVSQSIFSTSFLRINAYHYDPSGQWLVPEPHYFPRGPHARDRAAAAVLGGPAAWLAPSVQAGPTLDLDSTEVDAAGVVTVKVKPTASPLPDAEEQRVVTRMVWTFRQFPYVTKLRVLSADGTPWTFPGNPGGTVPMSFGLDASPVAAQTSRQLFAIRNGRLVRVLDIEQNTNVLGAAPGATGLTAAAVRGDAVQAAVVQNGRTLALAGVTEPSLQPILTAKSIGRPHFSRQGEVFAPVDGGLRVYANGAWTSLTVGGLPDGAVTNVRVAPDGTRLALVVRRTDGRCAAGIARIERHDGRIRVAGWTELGVRQLSGDNPSVTDVAWASDSEVLLVTSINGGTSVVHSDQEGAQSNTMGPAGATGISVLAGAPGVAPVVRLADSETMRYSSNMRWLPLEGATSSVLYPG